MTKQRLEAFTDGVLAIVLTILVLDIHLPDKHSWSALWGMRLPFITYAASFLLIATLWVNHHRMFENVKKVNNRIIWSNINLLFWVSLIPASTAWFGTNVFSVPASVLYAAVLFPVNIAFIWLTRTTATQKVKPESAGPQISFSRLNWLGVLVNIITILVAFIFPPFVLLASLFNVFLWR